MMVCFLTRLLFSTFLPLAVDSLGLVCFDAATRPVSQLVGACGPFDADS